MTRFILAAGVAALAITAPAAAGPHGGGHGSQKQAEKHGGGGGDHAQKQRGGGHAQKQRGGGQAQHANRGGGGQMRHAQSRPQHGPTHHVRQAQARPQHGHSQRTADIQRGHRDVRTAVKQRVHDRRQAQRELVRRNDALGRNNSPVMTMRDRRDDVRRSEAMRIAEQRDFRNFDWNDIPASGRAVGFVDGCPPGLAKKPVACMPPGLAQGFVGAPLRTLSQRALLEEFPDRLRYVYADTPDYYWRYGNGYAYQVNRESDLIRALMPLFGLGYTAGQPFPSAYSNYYLPSAYQPFYPQTPYYDYRYANGYVYQVDPYTGLIADVDPMLGYGYGYGQMMPLSYSAYNVPYQYRPYYYDTSDYYYRYAPGAIYQVDPTTSLITAVAALLSPGMTVGQPMPLGYSAYNVPYAYRTNYYDTPDAWYRYANGNIYRVDPTTQLVTALVAAALT